MAPVQYRKGGTNSINSVHDNKERSTETTAFTATHVYQKIPINTTNKIGQVVILPVLAGGEVGEVT